MTSMLTNDVLPLIDEAADRVYSLVQETPLVSLRLDGERRELEFGLRQARTAAAQRLLQTARRDQ